MQYLADNYTAQALGCPRTPPSSCTNLQKPAGPHLSSLRPAIRGHVAHHLIDGESRHATGWRSADDEKPRGRGQPARAVGAILRATNWAIGRGVVRRERRSAARAVDFTPTSTSSEGCLDSLVATMNRGRDDQRRCGLEIVQIPATQRRAHRPNSGQSNRPPILADIPAFPAPCRHPRSVLLSRRPSSS
jgi:hypothetical protein